MEYETEHLNDIFNQPELTEALESLQRDLSNVNQEIQQVVSFSDLTYVIIWGFLVIPSGLGFSFISGIDFFFDVPSFIISSFISLSVGLLLSAGLTGCIWRIKSFFGKKTLKFKNLDFGRAAIEQKISDIEHIILKVLAKDHNQHNILSQISENYEQIKDQYGAEFINTVPYLSLRQELINSFIQQKYQLAYEHIVAINLLQKDIAQQFSQWHERTQALLTEAQKAQNFKDKYNQYLKKEEKFDAIEKPEEINFKKIL